MDHPVTAQPPSPAPHHAGQRDRDHPAIAQATPAVSQPGRQWGMAALLLSCFLILVFAIFAIAVGAGAALGVLAQSVDEKALGDYVALVKLVEYLFIGASALALVFGILGLRSSWSRREPAGSAVSGTIVAVIALVLHVLLLIFTVRAADDMLREKPYWNKAPNPRVPWGR